MCKGGRRTAGPARVERRRGPPAAGADVEGLAGSESALRGEAADEEDAAVVLDGLVVGHSTTQRHNV